MPQSVRFPPAGRLQRSKARESPTARTPPSGLNASDLEKHGERVYYTFWRYVERVRYFLTSSRVYLALFDAIKRGRAREQPNLNSQHVKNHFSVSAYSKSKYERERSP